jgi:hypothetical protein
VNKDKKPKTAWKFLFVAFLNLLGLLILAVLEAAEPKKKRR